MLKILKDKSAVLFFVILLGGIILRFVAMDSVPPSLNWDEVSHGYNAYSILKTGKDEWGEAFPTIFRAYGDYKLPVYIYLTSISEAIFGLNVFSVRLVSILAGIGVVIFSYLLAKEFFDKRVALLSAFLVAVEPWSFFLSRGAFEANLSLFFIVSAAYFFIKAEKKAKNLILPSVLFGLSVWTYNSARVFVPFLLAFLVFQYKKRLIKFFKKQRKETYVSLGILALFFLPMFWQLLNPAGQARYGWVAIVDEGAVAGINQARVTSDLPQALNVFVNNRYTYFAKEAVLNWFSHFSPEYLFFSGGSHYQFSVPGYGLLYFSNIVLFPLGIIFLLRKKDKASYILLGWLLLSPIPSSLTREAPHVLRSITMLPVPMIISAFGFFGVTAWLKKKYKLGLPIILSLYLLSIFFFAEDYFSNYFEEYPVSYSWSWQYGYEKVVDYAKENYDSYDRIIVSKVHGEPHEFFLFNWPWDPSEYRNDENLVRFFQSDWYWVDRFDKFYFVNDWDIPKESDEVFKLESGMEFNCDGEACLLVTSQGNSPDGWRKLDTVNFLDETTAFEIYEN